MVDEGYAAVTSRGLAAAAGLKPQLVHYYFRTMDDLFVELFRRQAEANIVRFEAAVANGVSLKQLWRMNNDARAAARTIEFVALANHRKAIRTELTHYAERFRAAQLDAIAAALEAAGIDNAQMPPYVALLLMEGLAQVLGLERMIDVTSGHDETISFVEEKLGELGPKPSTPPSRRRLGSRRR